MESISWAEGQQEGVGNILGRGIVSGLDSRREKVTEKSEVREGKGRAGGLCGVGGKSSPVFSEGLLCGCRKWTNLWQGKPLPKGSLAN